MGCILSRSPEWEGQVKQSRAIEKILREDERRMTKEVKILLLGAGESGKSTILKQLKIVHSKGFTPGESEHYRQQIFTNLFQGMQMCLEIMVRLQISFADPSLKTYLPLFEKPIDLGQGQPFPKHYQEPLRLLWQDEGVRKAIKTGHEWAMPENIYYFYPRLDRLFADNYHPTHEDVLHTRGKTTGIVETQFVVKDLTYRVFDVGGQRSERKKWIHCFEGVTGVLFLVAISGYDQCLVEDKDSNQMQEALMLFDTISNSQWFVQTSMILFLNKTDLFKEKIALSPVSNYFPDYEGPSGDYEAARAYFKKRFVKLNRSSKKEIYTHYTCATDTSLMRVVMASVTDIIITRNLASIIL